MAKVVLADLDFGGTVKVTGLPTPTQPSDAVTKSYADAIVGPTNFGIAVCLQQLAYLN